MSKNQRIGTEENKDGAAQSVGHVPPRFSKRHKIGFAALIVLFMIPAANAVYPVNVLNMPVMITAINAAATTITTAIGTATTTIVAAIVKASADAKAMGNIQLRYQKELALGRSYVHVDSQFDRDIHATFQQSQDDPNSCLIMAQGEATSSAVNMQGAVVQSLQKAAISHNMGGTPAGWTNTKLSMHNAAFCSDADEKSGRCMMAAEKAYQNIDLMASNVFMPNPSATYDKTQAMAAQIFVRDVINPFPTVTLPPALEDTPQGRSYLAAHMLEQRRLSMAENSMQTIMASRLPQKGLARRSGISEMVDSDDISLIGLIKNQAEKFLDPEWHANLGLSDSQEELLKIMNRQMAFKIWMDFQGYQQMERIEGILATELAMDIKSRAEEMLKTRRNLVAKAAVQAAEAP